MFENAVNLEWRKVQSKKMLHVWKCSEFKMKKRTKKKKSLTFHQYKPEQHYQDWVYTIVPHHKQKLH